MILRFIFQNFGIKWWKNCRIWFAQKFIGANVHGFLWNGERCELNLKLFISFYFSLFYLGVKIVLRNLQNALNKVFSRIEFDVKSKNFQQGNWLQAILHIIAVDTIFIDMCKLDFYYQLDSVWVNLTPQINYYF